MTDFVLNFHSGWRNLVIIATVFVALFFIYALITKNTKEKQERIALSAWAGIIDVQMTLGIVLLVIYVFDNRYYGQLTGHWTLGIISALLAHVPTIYKRLNGAPSAQVRRIMGVALPIIVTITIVLGISAIDRPFFGG